MRPDKIRDTAGDATSDDRPPRRGLGRRGKPMRVEQLPDDVLRRYERQVLADPRTTGRSARQWLAREGYDIPIASVMRHRRRLAQVREREARGAARAAAIRTLAARHGLTNDDLAAGYALRARAKLLTKLIDAYLAVCRTRRPCRPDKLLTFAKAVRMYVG